MEVLAIDLMLFAIVFMLIGINTTLLKLVKAIEDKKL